MAYQPIFNSKEQMFGGLNNYLDRLDNAFSSQALKSNLPFIGNQLRSSSAGSFFSQIRSSLQDQIQAYPGNYGYGENVADILFKALGRNTYGGLDILQDLNGDKAITVADIQINDQTVSTGQGYGGYVDFKLRLGQASTFSTALISDLGLPKIGLDLSNSAGVSIGYSFDLNFGYELNGTGYTGNSTFYAETEDSKDISINVRANPNISGSGKLGILPIRATNQGATLEANFSVDIKDSADTGTRLTSSELLGLSDDSLIDTSLTGRAALKVNLATDFPTQARFPSLSTDFSIDWSLNSSSLDPNQPQTLGGVPKVEFNNVKLDIGTFLSNFVSPIFGEVQKVTKPVQPIVKFLTQPLPVISKLAKHNISVLDIAELAAKIDPSLPKPDFRYIKAVAEVVNLANSIPNGKNLFVNLGSFSLGNADARSSSFSLTGANPSITQAAPSWSSQLQGNGVSSFINKTQGNSAAGKLEFPILTDPNAAFNLLLGKTDTKLFTYRMPSLSFKGRYSQFASILGPLGVSITGTVGANINFEFGFDAFGLKQYSKSNNLDDLFTGFYVDADPKKPSQVNVFAGLDAGPSINLAIASFTIAGGVVGTIDFRLKDDGDSKVRANELVKNFSGDPLGRDLFKTSGAVIAGLTARANVIGLGSYEEKLANVTLLTYGGNPGFKQNSGKAKSSVVNELIKIGLFPLMRATPVAIGLVRKYGPTAVKVIQKSGVAKDLKIAASKGKQTATKAAKVVDHELSKASKQALAQVKRTGLNPVQVTKKVEQITVQKAAPAIKKVFKKLRF